MTSHSKKVPYPPLEYCPKCRCRVPSLKHHTCHGATMPRISPFNTDQEARLREITRDVVLEEIKRLGL